MLIVNKVYIQPGPDTVKETRAPGFHLLFGRQLCNLTGESLQFIRSS